MRCMGVDEVDDARSVRHCLVLPRATDIYGWVGWLGWCLLPLACPHVPVLCLCPALTWTWTAAAAQVQQGGGAAAPDVHRQRAAWRPQPHRARDRHPRRVAGARGRACVRAWAPRAHGCAAPAWPGPAFRRAVVCAWAPALRACVSICAGAAPSCLLACLHAQGVAVRQGAG